MASAGRPQVSVRIRQLGRARLEGVATEYVDETVRTHVGSLHIKGSSPYEFTNGLHENLGKMNLGSNLIAQPHTSLPKTRDLQFNLGDKFQPANVNFPLDYQPLRKNYLPNQVREDVAPH